MIGIGIDTGGTCTDAVVLNTDGNQVLSFSKTLTTKGDLKEGILKALRGLDENLVNRRSICLYLRLLQQMPVSKAKAVVLNWC